MKDRLLTLLKALEEEFKPPSGCHHAITYNQYGSDSTGWEDKLGLQIAYKAPRGIIAFKTFFLDNDDFEKPVSDLTSYIKENLI